MKISRFGTLLSIIRTVENWPIFVMNHFGLAGSAPLLCSLRNGVRYWIRPGTLDGSVIIEVWINRVYSPPDFEIGKDDIVVDIGAHIGVFSVFAATSSTAGKVFALEPFPPNYELLQKNISLNCLRNVVSIRKAIAGEPGKRRLFVSPVNTGAHSLQPGYLGLESIEVEAISLRDLIDEHRIDKIDYLKIDCEGSEYEILLNCPEDLLKKCRRISLEYHDIHSNVGPESLSAFLSKQGFSVRITPPPCGMIYAARTDLTPSTD